MKILKAISKTEVFEQELEKLIEIFKDVEESKQKLVQGLLQETAYLKSELFVMHQVLDEVGMIKVHPTDKTKQKTLPIANEYRRTANIYALNIKTLNGILGKDTMEGEDPFDKWLQEKMSKDE
ncbi:hypothetical protein [Cellulosilyticum lentocellum]|uniref:hypothetical protein n=1 Tax=Cellulosilyticum lentocellum TaxID=29360 RepID=UPI0038CBF834